jgi:transcription elongation factor GreB
VRSTFYQGILFAPMPTYLTPEGAKKLQEELAHLLHAERPRVVQEVSDAAAQGDRSENAEYIYGKKRLREIDRRIRFLTKRLDSAVVVKNEEARQDVVFFGATVEIEDEDGVRKRYRIVGPDEVNPNLGRISFQSPLGRALLKKKLGDVVTVRRPAGEIEVEIVDIAYE